MRFPCLNWCIGEGWRTPPGCPCDLGEMYGHFGRSWERGAWPAQNLFIVLHLMEPPRVMRLYCIIPLLKTFRHFGCSFEEPCDMVNSKLSIVLVYTFVDFLWFWFWLMLIGSWLDGRLALLCSVWFTFWFLNAHTFLIYCSLRCTFTLVCSFTWFVAVVWSLLASSLLIICCRLMKDWDNL